MRNKLVILLISLIGFSAGALASSNRTYEKQYLNTVYGFSVGVPENLLLETDEPPLPQHGCRLVISTNPEAYIWVGADYNAAEWGNLSEAQRVYLDFLKKDSLNVEELSQKSTYLHRLKALRSSSRYKNRDTGQIMRQDLLIAFRHRKARIAIVYTIELMTPEHSYERNKKIYEKVIRSWRSGPLP